MNYDKNKKNELLNFVKNLIGADMKGAEFKKENNRYFLEVRMKENELACQWLDKLLKNKDLKSYQIQGASQGKKAKMKVYVHCINDRKWVINLSNGLN